MFFLSKTRELSAESKTKKNAHSVFFFIDLGTQEKETKMGSAPSYPPQFKTSPQGEQYRVPNNENMPFIVQEALSICPRNKEGLGFDQDGLAYDYFTVSQILPAFRQSRDKHALAKHADVVTHAFCDWVANDGRITLPIADEVKKRMNPTSYACVAYVSLYASSATLRDEWTKLFDHLVADL